jgi:hypothetical protein
VDLNPLKKSISSATSTSDLDGERDAVLYAGEAVVQPKPLDFNPLKNLNHQKLQPLTLMKSGCHTLYWRGCCPAQTGGSFQAIKKSKPSAIPASELD